ncbi:MAG: sugar ABC transporter permease [Sphaerochaetaceae bacterium]
MNLERKIEKRQHSLLKKENANLFFIVGIALFVLYYAILFVYPLLIAMIRSFYDWNPLKGTQEYSGLDNYIDLFRNPLFFISLKNTIIFTTLAVIGRVALSLLISLGLVSITKGRDFLRGTFFLPVIMPIVAVSIIWLWVYHPQAGLLNMFLDMFGIEKQLFLKSPTQALYSVIVMVIWKDVGYSVIIFTAGLLGVPQNLKEASWIDGANRRQTFFAVTLPAIMPTFTFVLITAMISYFQSFVEIFILTGGGPGTSTYVISYLIFNEAFKVFNFGYASAISVILFTLITIITVIQLKLLQKGNEE